jgi:hypothetical protein
VGTEFLRPVFLIAGLCGAAIAQSAETPAAASDAVPHNSAAGAAGEKWAFLDKYCSECHNAQDWAGGVAFDTMTPDAIPADAETWEHAVRKLRGRLMPPPGKPQPEKAQIQSFVSWMETTLDGAAAAHPNPGRVELHRLNRKEYANAVSDLLALKVNPAELLPQDDVSDGFDNIAHVLQVSPSFLDQYVAAARSIAVEAIGDAKAPPIGTQYFVRAGSQQTHVEGLPLGTRGGMAVEHNFPADGEYELNIGNMAVALWVYNMEFEHTLIATLDGKKFYETKIGGEEDTKAIDQKQDPAVDAINERLKKIRFKATAGPHKVAVTFLHRSFAESDDRFYVQVPGGGQDRVLRIPNFDIRGPLNATGVSETPSRQRVFVCYPKDSSQEQACAEQIVTTLARKAFRRPVTDADMRTLLKFYETGRRSGENFESGIRRALTAILASPHFLYRIEPTPAQAAPGSVVAVSDLELASRLSFFLWSTVPDDELLSLATAGRLREPAVLAAQVKRMLADRRSETLASNFAFQWLNVARLAEIDPDPAVFPYAGDPREDFRTELKLFVDSVFREDRSVMELLTANYTYLNERLALHYDINNVKGDRWRRVALSDSSRWGLLGKGAVLMATAYPNRTAPVLRGAWILERITGTPPASPPPNVEALKEAKVGEQPKSVRELMAAHREKPTCLACHAVMDPLGFALENFDAVGKWRSKDRLAGTPIDASGELPDGTFVNGPDDLRKALTAKPEQFVQTLTEKLMTYALGRTVEHHDMPIVRAIVRDGAADNYRFSSLVMRIVNSAPFQMRTIPSNEPVERKTQTANVAK